MTIPGLIPIGTDVIVTAQGSVLMAVRCKRCHHVYMYEMFRSEPGGAFSVLSLDNERATEKAAGIADVALRKSLEKDCDPVPCPECGTYQPNMLPQLRHAHRPALRRAGIRILIAVGLWVAFVELVGDPLDEIAPRWVTWMGWAAASLVGFGLIVYRWYLGSRFDPNAQPDVERRKEIGRERVALDAKSLALVRVNPEDQPVPQKASEPVVGVQVALPADGVDRTAIRMEVHRGHHPGFSSFDDHAGGHSS